MEGINQVSKKKEGSFVKYAKSLAEPKYVEETFNFVHLSCRMTVDRMLKNPTITEEQKEDLTEIREELDRMWGLFHEMAEHIDE